MKKLQTFYIWEGPQAGMFKDMLAEEGIKCLVKNDRLSAGIGEIPFVECFPELWVIDDEVYPRARLLLDGWLAGGSDEGAALWTCAHCGEQSPQQFSVCWSCTRPREST